MEKLTKISDVRTRVKEWRAKGLSVGLVPTMGYLHEGHGSLIERSVRDNDRTVVSVFVNPMQFGPKEDLASYPRDIVADTAYCEKLNADIVFAPEANEMYTDGFCSYVDMSILTEELCGLSRPTHFRGVCTVVSKLFNIVCPDRAYFGEKDAQQLAIIRRMVTDLNIDTEVVGCPIVRESDGLAKSSRNTYLSDKERQAALVLHRAIECADGMLKSGEKNAGVILEAMKKLIEAEPLARTDYVKAVDALTMQQVSEIKQDTLFALAVYIGKTRLIDNISYRITESEDRV